VSTKNQDLMKLYLRRVVVTMDAMLSPPLAGLVFIRIIDSVKAYKPPHLVKYDDVRALIGVVRGDGQKDFSQRPLTFPRT
jgi:hypothetical protein